jgi:hypothetical protein
MKPSLAIAAVMAAAIFPAGGGVPQDAPGGIEVTGTGEVVMKPDTVVIRGEFSASADAAGDALTKFRDGRRRAIKMLESLAIEGLGVTGPGPMMSVGPPVDRNMRQMWDGSQTEIEPKVQIRETLTIKIGNLADPDASADLVAKVLDKAKEAGVKIGGSEMIPPYMRMAFGITAEDQKEQATSIAYLVSDRAKLEESACVKAMEDARKRAEILANAAGRKLGRVVRVTHDDLPAEKTAFDGVFRVKLHVVFDIER